MPRGKIQLPSSLTDESRADLTPSLLFEAVAARQGLVCCDPGVLLPGSQQVNKQPPSRPSRLCGSICSSSFQSTIINSQSNASPITRILEWPPILVRPHHQKIH